MFDVLRDCGALARLAPEFHAWCSANAARCAALVRALDAGPATPASLRFAALCHGLEPPQIQAWCERWRVDADGRELALLVAREWPLLRAAAAPAPDEALALLQRCDAWRRPERLRAALSVCRMLGTTLDDADAARAARHGERIHRALQAAQSVSVATLPDGVRRAAGDGPALGRALREARLHAIAEAFARL
jgi:tRNA nucleotidyltransferase (CCA-adding enzyme)